MDDAAWRRLETIFRKHAEKDQLEQQASSEAEPSSGSIQALPSPVEGQQTPADVPVSKVVSPKAQKRRFPFIPSFLQPAAQRRAQVEELGERTGAPQSDRLPSAGPTPVSPTKPISGLEKPIPSAPIQQKADQVAGKEGRRPPEPGRLAATPTRSEIRPVEAASTGEPVQAVPSRLSTAEVVSPEALTQLIPAGARGAEKAKVEPTLSQPVQRAPSPEVSAQLQAREVEAGVETKAEPAPLPREPRATEVPNQVLGSEVEAGVEAKAEPALLHPVQRASETEAPTQVLATGVPGVAEVKPAMVVPPAPPTRTLPDKRGRGVAPVRPQGPEAGVESVAAPEVQRAAQQPTVISAPPVSVPSPAVPGGEEGFAEETAAFEEGEVPLRPLSLEQIWPVEVLQSKPEPRPGGVETRPSPKVSEPQYLQEVAGQPVFEALKGVKPGQPTDSAVEVIAPRKPRPSAPVLQRREEAEVEPTTPVSQTQEAPSPVTTSPPAVQREVGAEETASGSEMIDTEIGLLPADLWQLIGQPPEQRRFAGQVSPVEPSAERTQMTGVHETSATGTPVSGVIQPAVDETEPEGVSAPAMPPVVHRFMEPQGRIFRVAGEEGGAAAAETAPEAEPAAGGEVNVDELALKVYGEVKRRLSVEWERFRRRF